jgi:hypothetical protein
MSTSRLFADCLYGSIRSTWELAQQRPNAGHNQPPTISILASLIDPAFRASIQKEEKEQLRFSILKIPQRPVERGRIFVLDDPLLYSDRTIRKLAGAFDSANSALLVEPQSDNREPIIWGFGYFGSIFLRIPVAVGYESAWPDALMIRAVSPGVLSIARGTSSLGLIEFGTFTSPIPSPVTSAAMGDLLINLISNDNGYLKHQVHYWQAYNKVLIQLLLTINRISHGATVVLVPPAHAFELTGKFQGGFTPQGSLQISEILLKTFEADATSPPGVGYKNRLDERITNLAHLACIDGALILTTELEVIAFGAKFNAPSWTGPVVVGPDGFKPNGEPFDLTRHGTRHNSAAALVAACDHAVAFVSSTDGPIRGFAKQGVTIVCWPDFRVSMFTHDTF